MTDSQKLNQNHKGNLSQRSGTTPFFLALNLPTFGTCVNITV